MEGRNDRKSLRVIQVVLEDSFAEIRQFLFNYLIVAKAFGLGQIALCNVGNLSLVKNQYQTPPNTADEIGSKATSTSTEVLRYTLTFLDPPI